MKFTKMQGCGNDYVYVNCFEEEVQDPAALAIQVSDRHFGIGSDGLILLKPSDKADCMMDMYNADGSRGAMCGNGIRCAAKLAYDSGVVDRDRITVETLSGIKTLDLTVEDGTVTKVRVDMGAPEPQPETLLSVDGKWYPFTAVSMGNPHAVIFIGKAAGSISGNPDSEQNEGINPASELVLDTLEIEKTGPLFEHHPAFPDRVNTEFVEVIDEHTLRMRVWERGSGETLACGTGACAVAVAAILTGRVSGREVTVRLRGGDLQIEWDEETGHVFMTGPAVSVFTGKYPA